MGFLGDLIKSAMNPAQYDWRKREEWSDSYANTPTTNGTAMMGYQVTPPSMVSKAEASTPPIQTESYGNPSTYTPANFHYGNPSTYTPSNPTGLGYGPQESAPSGGYGGGYEAPVGVALTEVAPAQPSELDILRKEWESNPQNLAQFHNGVIAGAKLEYEMALRNGNREGMLRASEKARLEREKAQKDGTFSLLDDNLATNKVDYEGFAQAQRQREMATRQRMIDEENARARANRDYAGYDSKNTDTSRNHYQAPASQRRSIGDEMRRYGKG